jgi:hypothetical protein
LAYKAARAEFCKLKQTNVEHNVYTFKEEHKVQVFENKNIFGHKWLKYMGNKKTLHNKNSVTYKVSI